jgi:hypothetical protein
MFGVRHIRLTANMRAAVNIRQDAKCGDPRGRFQLSGCGMAVEVRIWLKSWRFGPMADLVVAMASGGKPLKRILMGIGDRVFYLANPERIAAIEAGSTEPIGFPQEDVFELDEDVFAILAEQWARQRATDPETWGRLRRYSAAS